MKKQLGINFIAQILAFAVNFSVSFFLTPFIVQNIGVDANGFVSLANNFVEYAQLFTVALNSMAGRFITIKIHQKKNEEASMYFTSVFFANLILSAAITVVFVFVILYLDSFLAISAGLVTDVKILWALVFANFVVNVLASNFSVSTFITDRLDKTAMCNVRGYVLRALILVVCYTFFKPYTFYVGLAMLVMGLNSLFSHVKYRNQFVPELKINKKYFNVKCIKELILSGIWNTISRLSSILSSGLDLLITNSFVGDIAMGVFSLSKTVSNIVLSLFGMLSSVYAPGLTKLYAENDSDGMKKQLVSSVKLMGLFASIPIAVLIGFGHSFYQLWVPTEDAVLLQLLTVITSFNLIFALPLEPLYNIFTVTNKIKTSSIALIIFSICSITTVFIGLNFIDGENMKVIYIALVGAFYNVVRLLSFLPIYGAKCLGFKLTTFYPVILKNFLGVGLLSAIALGINYVLSVDSWVMLFVSCVFVALIGIVLNLFILFDKKERSDFFESIRRILKKFSAA